MNRDEALAEADRELCTRSPSEASPQTDEACVASRGVLRRTPQVAELAIELDDKEAALEFSERSGNAWLAQYAAVVYGIGPPPAHEALRDRLPAGTNAPGAVTLALLDYGWPSKSPVKRNLGDYLQTLAFMRHVARFHAPGAIRCDDRLDRVFAQLARSWHPGQRIRLEHPLDVAVGDRDCPRWRGEAWLPFFGWFGDQATGRVPTTFPLPAGLLPTFFSFHLHHIGLLTPALRDYLRRYEPIGCRDRTTRDRLASTGVQAFLSGCVTTTLALPADDGPPTRGPRYRVDDAGHSVRGATELTHDLDPPHGFFSERMAESLARLALYQRAASVSTSRLHCYLPCRALGTPVTFHAEDPADIRFDGLLDLDEDALRGMADGLTELIETILRPILAGADRETVYRRWREATAPLVERDEAERRRYTPLFVRRPGRGREDARPSEPIPVALTFDRNLIDYVPNLIRSVETHASRKIGYHLLVRGISGLVGEVLALVACVPCAPNRVRVARRVGASRGPPAGREGRSRSRRGSGFSGSPGAMARAIPLTYGNRASGEPSPKAKPPCSRAVRPATPPWRRIPRADLPQAFQPSRLPLPARAADPAPGT